MTEGHNDADATRAAAIFGIFELAMPPARPRNLLERILATIAIRNAEFAKALATDDIDVAEAVRHEGEARLDALQAEIPSLARSLDDILAHVACVVGLAGPKDSNGTIDLEGWMCAALIKSVLQLAGTADLPQLHFSAIMPAPA
jgi:hypothetical protein